MSLASVLFLSLIFVGTHWLCFYFGRRYERANRRYGSTIGGLTGGVIGAYFGASPQIGWTRNGCIGGYVDPDVLKRSAGDSE